MIINRELSSFGAQLQNFRIRRHLTQQQLAKAVGVHRNAIGRWERGDFLPESKAIVLELARHLHLDDQETRQLLEASLTALSPPWSVPLSRNPFFTGREEIMEALHTHLGADQALALTQSSALHGLGGVGKTQIALEYAYQHALEYSAVFWIGAETEEQIVSSLLRIADVLQLPTRDDKDQQHVIAAVQRWLSTHSQWLLIWDNVEDLALLDRFLPSARSGVLLITTRCQTFGTLARGLDLQPMEHEEGILFLLRRAKVLAPEATHEQVRQLAEQMPAQYTAAADLVTAMGGLPLAIDQAGAYMEATRCGLAAYLDLFHIRRAALLRQRGEGAREHPASVSTTFTLAITATAQHHPALRDLLQVCALLQSDAIPEELFRQEGEHLGAALGAVCRDVLEWNQVVGAACSYSLLSRQPEEQTLSLHRLVQAVLLDAMTAAEHEKWCTRAIEALDRMFPEVLPVTEQTTWKLCERLLPHALICLQQDEATEKSLALASLAYKAAQYLRARGRYVEAGPLYQRALHIREHVLGPDHPDVARVLNYLAVLYWSQGKYVEAEPLYQRALHIREHVLGPDHPDVASSLNNLALLYWSLGKYVEAEPLYQRTVHIREQAQGLNHPDVAISLNNLAALYWEQGKCVEAEPLYQRALPILEQALGQDHPLVAQALNNLALLYRDQGKYVEAERLYQQTLHILEQAMGPAHLDLAQALNNLANLSQDQGKYGEAEAFYQRALRISEQSQGSGHLDMATSLNGLANLSRDQGKYGEAEAFYQRALSIREQHLGQHHPETAQTLHDLATLRQKQGNLNEAISFAERTLEIRLQSLGDTHSKTIATQVLYAQLVQDQVPAQEDAVAQRRTEGIPDALREDRHAEESLLPLQEVKDPSFCENDPLQGFLDAHCELHPHAWCRSADLWQAYEHWTEKCHNRFPLSRGGFIVQLKARGCRADRTKTARIWRGIALLKENDDGR